MRFTLRIAVAVAVAHGSASAWSGRDLTQLSLEELMNIPVVSVSKTKKPLLDNPVTAVVVTRHQIQERGYRDLLDVLRDQPGIHIVDLSISEHAGSEVFVRGVDAHTKMLFLMNGEEMAPPTGEPLTMLRQIPLVAVKQVEISYGAASSLYGADAIAGIVNVVTYSGHDDSIDRTEVWVSGGTYDTYETQARHSIALNEKIALAVSGSFHTSSQEDLPGSYPEIWEGFDVDPKLRSHHVNARLEAGDFSLAYLRMSGERNNALGYQPSLYDYSGESTWDVTDQFVHLRFDREWDDRWSTHTVLSYGRTELDSSSSYRTDFSGAMNYGSHYFYWKGESTRLAHDVHLDLDRVSWLSGAEVKWYESIPKTDIDNPLGSYDVNYRNASAFTQVELEAASWLDVTAGIRHDHDSRFEREWNPRVGALVHPMENLRAHVNWGTAYLAPSPHKVYERWGQVGEGEFVHLPNPDLKPEQTSTIDAGVDWFPTDRSYVGLSGFHTTAEDLWRIAFQGPIVIDGYDMLYQTNANVAESKICGFHCVGDYEFGPGFRLEGHYTYTGGEQDAVDLEGNVDFNHMPRHLLLVAPAWQGESANVRLAGRWFDRMTSNEDNAELAGGFVDGAWTFDLFAAHRVLENPNFRIGVDVRNLFDEQYEKLSKYDEFFFSLPTLPQPRRTLFVTGQISF